MEGIALFFLLFQTPFGLGVLVFVVALVIALVKPKKVWKKLVAAGIVVVVAISPIVYGVMYQRKFGAEATTRYEESERLFLERCKTAGERIYRTDTKVRGVLLLKVRPRETNVDRQFDLTDPYGNDLGGDGYIESFLKTYNAIATIPPTRLGYDYVDTKDSMTGTIYRYTGSIVPPEPNGIHPRLELSKEVVGTSPSKYGVSYADISTHEDRQHWIAGSSLQIIDLNTNAIVAERVGYMMDPGQGSRAGGRSPWLEATNHSCPSFGTFHAFAQQRTQTVRFVTKILQPIGEP